MRPVVDPPGGLRGLQPHYLHEVNGAPKPSLQFPAMVEKEEKEKEEEEEEEKMKEE